MSPRFKACRGFTDKREAGSEFPDYRPDNPIKLADFNPVQGHGEANSREKIVRTTCPIFRSSPRTGTDQEKYGDRAPATASAQTKAATCQRVRGMRYSAEKRRRHHASSTGQL
jgi:hypothetical protein